MCSGSRSCKARSSCRVQTRKAPSADPTRSLVTRQVLRHTSTTARQVFRTEVLSRRLPPKSTFKIMAVSLAGVAVLMSGAAGLAHPGEVADLVHRCGGPSAGLEPIVNHATSIRYVPHRIIKRAGHHDISDISRKADHGPHLLVAPPPAKASLEALTALTALLSAQTTAFWLACEVMQPTSVCISMSR